MESRLCQHVPQMTYSYSFAFCCSSPLVTPAVDTGKLGAGGLTIEQGQASARVCVLNGLAQIKNALGSLDEVARIVKLVVFVASKEGTVWFDRRLEYLLD